MTRERREAKRHWKTLLVAQCINDARFRRHVEGGGYWKLLEIAWIERLRFYLRGGDW